MTMKFIDRFLPVRIDYARLALLVMFGIFTMLFVIASMPAAFAQEAVTRTADFSFVFDYVAEAIASIVVVLAGVLMNKLRTKFNLNIDAQQRAVVEQGLQKAIAYAMAKAGPIARDKLVFQTDSEHVQTAAQYASTAIPAALAYFKITPQQLSNMIAARLGENNLGTF